MKILVSNHANFFPKKEQRDYESNSLHTTILSKLVHDILLLASRSNKILEECGTGFEPVLHFNKHRSEVSVRSTARSPHSSKGMAEPSCPRQASNYFLVPRGDVPRVITQRLLRPCVHFHSFLHSSSPIYIYIYLYPLYFPSFPSLFHPPLFPLRPLLRPLRANRCGQALSSKPQKGRYPPPSFAARGIRISSASRKINRSQPGDVPENGRTNGIFVKLKRKG